MKTKTEPETQPADITAFLTDLAREPRSEQTWRAYRSDLTLFARWLAQTTDDLFSAKALTRIDVRDYKQHLLSVEGRKPATINRRLAALRAFAGWAKKQGLLTDLPTEGIAGVPVPKQAPRALEPRAIDRVLRRSEQSGNLRDHAILLTLYHTGIRVSELCDLRVSDVETSERKGSLTVRAGKGMKQRTIPLTIDARKAITRFLAEREHPAPNDVLFISRRTQSRLTAKAVRQIAGKYGYQAMVEDTHPHAFRHSFATELLRKGAPLPTVGALLGHESLQSTARYTQPSERDLRDAVNKLALTEER